MKLNPGESFFNFMCQEALGVNQFIYDMIHMTEGEKLINYWWLWLLMFIGVIVVGIIKRKLEEIDRGGNDET